MSAVILQPPPRRWECPNCPVTEVTRWDTPNRFHRCTALAGITAPLVPAGTRCRVEAREREDYIGRQDVTYDGNGRPVMSVVTTRDDGQDCAVFAPTVHMRIEV